VSDVFLFPDGHAQERFLFEAVLKEEGQSAIAFVMN
jgi:hypothetical protein